MKPEPAPAADRRPAGSQFSLRGMFALLTATSVIFAILALVIRSPLHWLGALFVPVICGSIIAMMELARRWFPPPRWRREQLGENPFGPPITRPSATEAESAPGSASGSG